MAELQSLERCGPVTKERHEPRACSCNERAFVQRCRDSDRQLEEELEISEQLHSRSMHGDERPLKSRQ